MIFHIICPADIKSSEVLDSKVNVEKSTFSLFEDGVLINWFIVMTVRCSVEASDKKIAVVRNWQLKMISIYKISINCKYVLDNTEIPTVCFKNKRFVSSYYMNKCISTSYFDSNSICIWIAVITLRYYYVRLLLRHRTE